MAVMDSRVDAYIKNAAPFARPILTHLRQLVHKACPDVTETIKWGFPNFGYNNAILCNMAAFKAHCSFGFWKASLLSDPDHLLQVGEKASMGHLGRLLTLKDLPVDKVLLTYIKEAAILNETGAKAAPRPKKAPASPKKEEPIPPAFLKALQKNKKTLAAFEAFPPSHKREYITWITEAKTEDTRLKRMATALEWIADGKSRNWKYQKK